MGYPPLYSEYLYKHVVKILSLDPTHSHSPITAQSVVNNFKPASIAAYKGSLHVGTYVCTPTIVCSTLIHIRICVQDYPTP